MRTAFYAAAALGAAAAFFSVPAMGQQDDSAQDKIRKVVIYGRDPCPRGTGDEIVVCARRPETERYRIPEALREPSDNPDNESWASHAETIEYVGRSGIQSCSTVGSGGASGCWDQMVRAWREDRRTPAPPGR
ncbi:MAG TPA: hypothetical protein VIT45_12680 [Allosphingosinicella sp.]